MSNYQNKPSLSEKEKIDYIFKHFKYNQDFVNAMASVFFDNFSECTPITSIGTDEQRAEIAKKYGLHKMDAACELATVFDILCKTYKEITHT